MILTRCRLDLRDPLARAETHDLARMHLRVVDAAQGIPVPDGGRLLWSQPRPGVLMIQTGGPVSGKTYGLATSVQDARDLLDMLGLDARVLP